MSDRSVGLILLLSFAAALLISASIRTFSGQQSTAMTESSGSVPTPYVSPYEGELTISLNSSSPIGLVAPGLRRKVAVFKFVASDMEDVTVRGLVVHIIVSDPTMLRKAYLRHESSGDVLDVLAEADINEDGFAQFEGFVLNITSGAAVDLGVYLDLDLSVENGGKGNLQVVIGGYGGLVTMARVVNRFPVMGNQLWL